MRLHRFFVQEEPLSKKEISISSREHINQWKNVFRFKTGDSVILFNGSGFDATCTFTLLTKNVATLSVLNSEKNITVPKREIWLFCSLIKKDKFEWVVEKGTEIGVLHFVPILSERSEKKNLNFERIKRIIIEATEQSGHSVPPVLHTIVPLKDALETLSVPAIVFDGAGKPFSELSSGKSTAVFIGSEGGWSENEKNLFKEKNIPSYSLGAMTLKSETAALAAASLLLAA